MIYNGHVENGRIVLDEQVTLPEGVQVRIDVLEKSDRPFEWLKELAADIPDAPDDLASQHDHYLYGTPKR